MVKSICFLCGLMHKKRGSYESHEDELMRKDFLPFHVPDIEEEEIRAVADTLRAGWLTTGPKVKRFEEEFAKYVGARHAIAVNSGTAALHLALDAAEELDQISVDTGSHPFAVRC